VWYHDVDDTDSLADYITAYDYDGDQIGDNNWDNLHTPDVDLGAVVYWSVVETQTHWFILYADFHPRDWDDDCSPPLFFLEPCHENDMEGAMVVVKKDGTPYGSFFVLYTEAHNALHIFHNDSSLTQGSTEHLESTGVTFEKKSHPELYVEAKGHGVCALYFIGKDHCKHQVDKTPPEFPGGDGIVYRYKGVAEKPSTGSDSDVGYALVPLETTLWAQRFDICDGGCTFDKTFTYDGVEMSLAFDGDDYGDDKANPPWGWDDPDDGPVYRGDFFFRPAKALKTHVISPDEISQVYLYNPFLDSLQD